MARGRSESFRPGFERFDRPAVRVEGYAEGLADLGDDFGNGEVGEIAVVLVGQVFVEAGETRDSLGVAVLIVVLDEVGDDVGDLGLLAGGLGADRAHRLGLGLAFQPGLQGQGLAHGAGNAGIDQAGVGAGFDLHLVAQVAGELHADLGELLQQREARLRGGGNRIDHLEQIENTLSPMSSENVENIRSDASPQWPSQWEAVRAAARCCSSA